MELSRRQLALAAVLLVSFAGCTNPADTSPAGSDATTSPTGRESGASTEEGDSSADGSGGSSDSGGPGADSGSGDSSGDGAGGSGSSDNAGEGPGGGSVVVGSPITLPSFQQLGAPIVDVYGSLVDGLEEACGGSLCVEVEVEAEDGLGPESTCLFAGTRPAGGEKVDEGATVTFLTEPPCEGFDGTGEEQTGEGDTTEGEGDGDGTGVESEESVPDPGVGEESTTTSDPPSDPSTNDGTEQSSGP